MQYFPFHVSIIVIINIPVRNSIVPAGHPNCIVFVTCHWLLKSFLKFSFVREGMPRLDRQIGPHHHYQQPLPHDVCVYIKELG